MANRQVQRPPPDHRLDDLKTELTTAIDRLRETIQRTETLLVDVALLRPSGWVRPD